VLNKAVKKFWPVGLVIIFLLFVGFIAITQEAEEESVLVELPLDDMLAEISDEDEGESPPAWEPPGPPRWFRSNAGGMLLEETTSRLAALRNKYALAIDYVPPDEVDPRLLSYFKSEHIVEIRTLYEQGKESRRQWLFRDESGIARLNAVFVPQAVEGQGVEQPEEQPEETAIEEAEFEIEEIKLEEIETEEPEIEATETIETEIVEVDAEIVNNIDEIKDSDKLATDDKPREAPKSMGFIEVFNEKTQITEERQFFDNDSEVLIIYSYNKDVLIKAEAQEKLLGEEYRTTYVDHYRYNRSYSLRHVERQFFNTTTYNQPIRLTFPGRVLDAARDENFISDKLAIFSDFFGDFFVGEGYRMIYNTDSRGRILTQTMLNEKDEEVWVINNTWSGDRIVAMQKIEGEDEKITEYEYNGAGDRIVQRDINNGVLERLVRIDGVNETEELYMDGNLVLKAYWVNGRKISEERVRRR